MKYGHALCRQVAVVLLMLTACIASAIGAQIEDEHPSALLQDTQPSAQANFGRNLAVQGATLVVAAPLATGGPVGIGRAGKVTILNLVSGSWIATQELVAVTPNIASTARFGQALALDGPRLCVSEPFALDPTTNVYGKVHLYDLDASGVWTAAGTLPNGIISDPQFQSDFGNDLELHGNHLFVANRNFGYPSAQASGRVLYYFHDGSTWQYIDEVWCITPSHTRFALEIDVDLASGILAVSEPSGFLPGTSSRTGSVFAYRLLGDGTTPYLIVPDGRILPPSPEHNGEFGRDVAVLPGGRIAVSRSSPFPYSVHIFAKSASTWIVEDRIDAPDGEIAGFGNQLEAYGNRLHVLAPFHSDPAHPGRDGAAFVYCETAGYWNQTRVLRRPPGLGGFYAAYGLAVADDVVVVASHDAAVGGLIFAGVVAVFDGSNHWDCARASTAASFCSASEVTCPGSSGPGVGRGGCPNSRGAGAELFVQGTQSTFGFDTSRAVCTGLPTGNVAVLWRALASASQPGYHPLGTVVGQGVRCLTGTYGAFPPRLADANGIAIWPRVVMEGPPYGSVLTGVGAPYQVWYRDVTATGAPTSNWSNGVLLPRYP
jgi:hypothetical protein